MPKTFHPADLDAATRATRAARAIVAAVAANAGNLEADPLGPVIVADALDGAALLLDRALETLEPAPC